MMASDESDDEPLSVLAANKKGNPVPVRRKTIAKESKAKLKRKKVLKKYSVTIELSKPKGYVPEIPPTDVWLYLKDLNATGPYSCLLCADWFINRSKLVLHYVLNHKKDFCGVCRYFVPDRESFIKHMAMHSPWQCSQCTEVFLTEPELRQHLSNIHNLVHCRICHFQSLDDDTYNRHLTQKHNVNNLSSKEENTLWEVDEDRIKFLCLLCSKSNILCSNYFNHYMSYHRFTLRCMSNITSGIDPPFTISGANIRAKFIESQIAQQNNIAENYCQNDPINGEINPFIPEIKQEVISDSKDIPIKKHSGKKRISNLTLEYEGVEDFDVTLTEIIVFNKSYHDYLKNMLTCIQSKKVPEQSDINCEDAVQTKYQCSMCTDSYEMRNEFKKHVMKMHLFHLVPQFCCRVCSLYFESVNDLTMHVTMELEDYGGLWLCQFCDDKFENRQLCREHLTNHWEFLDSDNCYSPHLGFRCRYCPKLFWFETDRETHLCEEHFESNVKDFYTCGECNKLFSDKVWFTYHYYENHVENSKQLSYLHKCCVCSLVTGNVDDTRSHFQKNHPANKKMFCSLAPCKSKPFAQKKSFKYHVLTVHAPSRNRPDASFCDVCQREFKTQRAYSTHMTTAHSTGRFKCKLCSESLLTGDERKLHYLLMHPGQHPFKCPQCGKQFTHKSSMYGHLATVHNHKDQVFKCQHCEKEFSKKESYKEHLLIHEGPRHSCSYCPMTFAQRSNMLRHERRHTGERPYTCPHCPRTFSDKGACSSHVRTHLKTTFPCMYCGQEFRQKSKLTYHIRKHTGENLEECQVCSKIFTSGCSLREHMKTHRAKSEPKAECPICNREYVDVRHMNRHIKNCHSHSTAEFICPICEKQLGSIISLRQHVVIHANKNMYRCTSCRKSFNQIKGAYRHVRLKHNFKDTKYNIQKYVRQLNVKDIGLNLDEHTLIQIFGEKRVRGTNTYSYTATRVNDKSIYKNNEVGIGENQIEEVFVGDMNDGTTSVKIERMSDDEDLEPINFVKIERMSDDEDIEPINFVSVKIEPMNDSNSN